MKMSATLQNSSGIGIATFVFTGDYTKVFNVLNKAVHKIYRDDDFESLTSQDKLDLLSDYIKKEILLLARDFYINDEAKKAAITAIAAAETEITDNHEFNG